MSIAAIEVLYTRLLQLELNGGLDDIRLTEKEVVRAILRESEKGIVLAYTNRIVLQVEHVTIGESAPTSYVRASGDWSAIKYNAALHHQRRHFSRDQLSIMAASQGEAKRQIQKVVQAAIKKIRENT